MQKISFILILLLSIAISGMAQETTQTFENTESEVIKPELLKPDTFSLPPLTYRGTIAHYPYWNSLMYGMYDWSLHPGLNGSFSASAIFGFGNHSGVGFSNTMALMYAGNITPKLSYAIGGYASFLDYSSHLMKDAGLTAMLNYRFDEHWEAAVFAQKSLVKANMPRYLYGMGDVGDKIGASLRYHFNPSFSIGLSVWEGRYHDDRFW